VRFYPSPGRAPGLQQMDEASCTQSASHYVKLYVECMQARGYQPEIIGQNGVHMTVAQLPDPPPGVQAPARMPVPMQTPMQRPVPVTSGCESQANQCHPCPNGRASTLSESGGCLYDNVSTCRSAILQYCKATPTSDGALNVRGGKLTNDQVGEPITSCRNIPHGMLPYSGSDAPSGNKKAQQCPAFEKTYFACSMLFPGFDKQVTENRGKCLRETYTGP
jgi:hypothetical protein